MTTNTYDPAGNRTAQTSPGPKTTSTVYDADNEPTSQTYSDGVTHQVTYVYDADGRRTSMTDATGTTTYTYDALGRLTASTNGAGQSTGYGYDAATNSRRSRIPTATPSPRPTTPPAT